MPEISSISNAKNENLVEFFSLCNYSSPTKSEPINLMARIQLVHLRMQKAGDIISLMCMELLQQDSGH